MIIGLIIFGLILLIISYGVVYLITYLPTLWTVKTEKLKKVRRLISLIGGLLITAFYIFVSPTNNNDTATIQAHGDQFLVTLTGERLLMTHDPISFLKRGTYTDTLQLIIPRDNGTINGGEIQDEYGHYNMTGALIINKDEMKVDLYYRKYDSEMKDPLSWNDDYKLK